MADILKYIVAVQLTKTDPDAYLLRLDNWPKDIASAIAKTKLLELSVEHSEIINFLRCYYSEFSIAPNVRTPTKAMAKKYGEENASRKHLHNLIPRNPPVWAVKSPD